MTFYDVLLKRESCRAYQPGRTVSREMLVKICEAGRLSPSGCNAQPWKFIVVDEADAKEKLCDALVVEGGKTGAPWSVNCSAFIILVEQKAKLMPAAIEHYKDSQRFAQGDIGMACMNMCYQAMELGLSTCVIGLNDQKKMEAAFGIPEGDEVRLVLAMGYSAEKETGRPKARKAFEDVVCFNSWK